MVSHDEPNIAELVDELDETLFTAVLHNDEHVPLHVAGPPHQFIPSQTQESRSYDGYQARLSELLSKTII